METGSQGTFVISWSQTETDGLMAATLDILTVGATWRWTGQAVRVDGPQSMLILTGARGAADLRKRAARMVRRLIGAAIADGPAPADPPEGDMPDQSFVVTDGRQTYPVTLITVPDSATLLAMVIGTMPPADQDLWVVRAATGRAPALPGTGGVICFTPDTAIATPLGPRLIQTLQPGDLVQTRDNGPQPVLWIGHRRISGARLHALPRLRPVRFRLGAMGTGRPDRDLLVSPQHRMLVQGPAALALFNSPEVLVAAEHLINDHSITVDVALRAVTYIHVLLARHNVIWANGLATESFHPANAALDTLDDTQRAGLFQAVPGLDRNPQSYGDFARRNLSPPEAAILRHDFSAKDLASRYPALTPRPRPV